MRFFTFLVVVFVSFEGVAQGLGDENSRFVQSSVQRPSPLSVSSLSQKILRRRLLMSLQPVARSVALNEASFTGLLFS